LVPPEAESLIVNIKILTISEKTYTMSSLLQRESLF
jgi:hypothetical protein